MESNNRSGTFKKTAKSGRTGYAPPVKLRENRQTKIEVVPHFIPKNGDEALAISIKKYSVDEIDGGWLEDKGASFSLSPEETMLLSEKLVELQALIGAKPNQRYIAVPLGNEALSFPQASSSQVVEALIRAISNPQLAEAIAAHSPSESWIRLMKTGLRIGEIRAATTELSRMLSDESLTEHDYQRWFDLHYWVFGNAYVAKDEIKRIGRSDNIDLLLKQTASGLRDIVELKRPISQVLDYDPSHKQYYFSREASKAIGQCDRYLNVFSEVARKGLIDEPDIVAHHPRAIIVIGRSNDWDKAKREALHSLNSRLHGITVMTFDHVLEQACQMLAIVNDKLETSAHPSSNVDDEIPF